MQPRSNKQVIGKPKAKSLKPVQTNVNGVPLDLDHAADVQFDLHGPAKVIDRDESSADSIAYLEPAVDASDGLGRVAVTMNSGYFAGAVDISAVININISININII
ncbi:MAG: hypothetical protein V2A61_00065 [Calditrichota bacterium]